jgi:hypothetical protein
MWLWSLLACSPPPPPPLAPETHSWKDEGELVIQGLDEVEDLWKQGQKEAARTLAERVYTDRWEPQLERAVERSSPPEERMRLEYQFGLLMADLEGKGTSVSDRVHELQEEVRVVADTAARNFPPPASAGLPAPPPPASEGSHPIVPDVKPAWDGSSAAEPAK